MAQPTANLAQDLVRIHKVITRSLEVGLNSGKQYLGNSFPQPAELAGYSSYIYSLGAVLKGHHTSEDVIAFPALRKVLPLAPIDRLTRDHQSIEDLLAGLTGAINGLTGSTPQKNVEAIVDIVEKISSVWYPHIKIEEEYFSEQVLDAVIPKDEQRRLSEETSKHSQEYSNPPYWVVPFVLYNLDQEERNKMAASLPPAIMEELVPKVWKDQWAPMKPFLLD